MQNRSPLELSVSFVLEQLFLEWEYTSGISMRRRVNVP